MSTLAELDFKKLVEDAITSYIYDGAANIEISATSDILWKWHTAELLKVLDRILEAATFPYETSSQSHARIIRELATIRNELI